MVVRKHIDFDFVEVLLRLKMVDFGEEVGFGRRLLDLADHDWVWFGNCHIICHHRGLFWPRPCFALLSQKL